MNSFFNISSGYTACYKENAGSYNESTEYTAPKDVYQNDPTVLQKDFYATKNWTEVPTSIRFDDFVDTSFTIDEDRQPKAYTEFDFCLQDYTNIKNIILEYQVDCQRVIGYPMQYRVAENFLMYRQNEYTLLDYIENIEVCLGSNKVVINSYMQDTNSIKKWLQTMPKSDVDIKIAGKLGLSNNFPVTAGDVIVDSGYVPSGQQDEQQADEFSALMTPSLKSVENGTPEIYIQYPVMSVKASVPLYMIVPFFNQELSYLPKGMPIFIKINWRVSSYYKNFTFQIPTDQIQPSWTFGSNAQTYLSSAIDVVGGQNWILNGGVNTSTIIYYDQSIRPRNPPTIKYLYSRMTNNAEIDAALITRPYTFNYYTFLSKEFPLDQTKIEYTVNFDTNMTVPLELMMSVNQDGNNGTNGSTSYRPKTQICYKPFGCIDFNCTCVEVRGNGELIKSLGRKYITDQLFETYQDESEWCIERLLAVENNSDATYQNKINHMGNGSKINGSPYILCLANGGMFKRMLRPNVNGVTNVQVIYNIINPHSASTIPSFPANKFMIGKVYLKYLTQLLVDENYQVTLVNNPAISI